MRCRLCDRLDLVEVMNLGMVALAGGFLKPEEFDAERLHRLRVGYCKSCYSLAVMDDVEDTEMFGRYFYYTSSTETMRAHFWKLADRVCKRFKPKSVLEIGCNDGAVLRHLPAYGVEKVLGVDPSRAAKEINDERITVISEYWSEDLAKAIGKVDVVLACNVFAHITDLNAATKAVKQVLADSGTFVVECHYLGAMVAERQYDAIYHEHRYYHSLLALEKLMERNGMVVFDVEALPTHAGSMRFYICRKGAQTVMPIVNMLRQAEIAQGLHQVDTFFSFADAAKMSRVALRAMLEVCREEGKRVAGYGASGRANTIIQFCGLDKSLLEYMVDDAPAKWGYHTPGSHFKIEPRSFLLEDQPECVLLFAWPYVKEIAPRLDKFYGDVVVPLPRVRVLGKQERMAA